MAYEKLNLADGQKFTAAHVAHIEDGIVGLSDEIEELKGGGSVVVTSKGNVLNITVDDGETIAVNGDTEAEVTLICQGKNFVPEFPVYNKNGLVGTQNEDGSYTISGTYTGTSKAYIAPIPNTAPRFLPAGTYTASSSLVEGSGINRPVIGYTGNASQKQSFWAGSPQQFTLDEPVTFYCFIEILPGAVVDATFWMQLERGTKNTEYEVHRREEVVGNLPIELSPPAGENILYTETGDTLTVNQTKAGGSVIRIDNPLKGKTIAFLGDSITTTYYAHNYWQMIAEKTGCIPLGYGKSKSRIATVDGDDVESFVTRAAAMDTSADAVFVMGGTNDCQLKSKLGAWDSTDASTFYGGLNALITLLRTNYPGKPIVFATPIKRKADADNGFPDTMADLKAASATEDITMQHCVLAIKAKCARHGIPVVDLAEHSGIGAECTEYYGEDDSLHPSELGYVRIANMVHAELEKQFRHKMA